MYFVGTSALQDLFGSIMLGYSALSDITYLHRHTKHSESGGALAFRGTFISKDGQPCKLKRDILHTNLCKVGADVTYTPWFLHPCAPSWLAFSIFV